MPTPAPLTLNIIGPGKLGATLGRLLADAKLVTVASLYSRDPSRARSARDFIGQGSSAQDLAAMTDASLWLIATPDGAIADSARALAATGRNWRGRTVFHCSGIHSAAILAPLAELGAATASLHPAHSFADPARSLASFAGSLCTFEGSAVAGEELGALFSAIGARMVTIETAAKPLYHAATAVASNHLVALLADSLAMLTSAGIDEADARALLKPLVLGSANNALAIGPGQALTGPIARGDADTLARHLEALRNRTPELLPPYLALAREALKLATANTAPNAGHQVIANLLDCAQGARVP